jgi:hypothetical protein
MMLSNPGQCKHFSIDIGSHAFRVFWPRWRNLNPNSQNSDEEVWTMVRLDAWLACGVMLSTAATDALYVMFNSAVSAQRRVPAATWSSVWYLLSAFAVISYTKNWVYVCFAAVGSWIGAYVSMTLLRRAKGRSAPGAV